MNLFIRNCVFLIFKINEVIIRKYFFCLLVSVKEIEKKYVCSSCILYMVLFMNIEYLYFLIGFLLRNFVLFVVMLFILFLFDDFLVFELM